MNALTFQNSPAVGDWIERARAADIVDVARRLQPRLRRIGANWAGPCPRGCARDDGFAITPRRRLFICRPSGAAGNIIAMVMHAISCGFNEACAHINGEARPGFEVLSFGETLRRQKERAAHIAELERRRAEESAIESARKAFKLTAALETGEASLPLEGGLGEAYFSSRGIVGVSAPALRFHPHLRHWLGGGHMPAIVARVSAVGGDFLGIHATFLTEDGRANTALGDRRKLMLGSVGGGGVRFGWPSNDDYYVVGEGIESVLSAMRLWTASAGCAALSASRTRKVDTA